MDKLITKTLDQRLNELYGRINYERQIKVSPDEFRLQNMRELLRRLGDPQRQYGVVHVAGTKGKGSVATMVGSILTASGLRAGVYTSPHLETINQRMAVDGTWVSDAQLLELLQEIDPVVRAMDDEADPVSDPTLTFFEITTAATMLFFARQKVDFAVLEVGLGGRMDSTNVCEPDVCVITNISLDHTKQLGSTLGQIAGEKAGIIKPGIPVVSGATEPSAAAAIERVAGEKESPLFQLGPDLTIEEQPVKDEAAPRQFSVQANLGTVEVAMQGLEVSLPGAHQRQNAALAVAAVSLLDSKFGVSDEAIRNGLKSARLHGRAEVVCRSPLVILDIAHNPASASALADTLSNEIPAWRAANRRVLIFATSRDKNAKGMLKPFIENGLVDEIRITQYQTNPRAAAVKRLVNAAKELAVSTDAIISESATPNEAWATTLANLGPNDAVCIAGSAFLVAELRPVVQRWSAKETD